ncbi:MAG: fucose 4-O-acetylase-like acetyltransferase [Psychroserpens sp.]|jgi:fucose 4-O-acetylase-like acetyltransferase|uniref:acyltransferase family protein n=1 Tax=Psychroserpens sp. TaxID=2020870 RepID=UPI0039E58528
MRLKNIDLFKGLLIILVILGHVLQGNIDEAIWRKIIYSFHMPLFIGISGFLFNVNRVVDISYVELIKKYIFRVILPWTIAVLAYFSLTLIHNDSSDFLNGLIKAFINPYYHLWFIPGFLSWVVLTWLLKKFKIGDKLILVIAFLISLSPILLKQLQTYQDLEIINSGINLLLYTFRPQFYFFFVFGLIYRNIKLKRPKLLEYILPSICFILVVYLFYNPNTLLSRVNFFLLNSLMLSLILKVSVNNMISDNKTIGWIGLNSLAIYLWHVLPILICKFSVGTDNLALFYSATIFTEILFIVVYYYLLRIDFLKKYVFGI